MVIRHYIAFRPSVKDINPDYSSTVCCSGLVTRPVVLGGEGGAGPAG